MYSVKLYMALITITTPPRLHIIASKQREAYSDKATNKLIKTSNRRRHHGAQQALAAVSTNGR